MKVTQKLREYMLAHGVAADASEDELKSAVASALVSGKLDTKTLDELTAEADPKAKIAALVSEAVDAKLAPLNATLEKLVSLASKPEPKQETKAPAKPEKTPDDQNPADVFQKAALAAEKTDPNLRVKAASEWYDGTKSGCVWQKEQDKGEYQAGKPAFIWEGSGFGGAHPRYIDNPSQKELAKMAAFLKWKIGQDIPELRRPLNDHETDLLNEAVHKDRWIGDLGKSYLGRRQLKEFETKAVLDESGASQGDQAVPEYFDDAIIRTPLLHGELFPYVEVVNVPRGSSADGFTIGTPTFVSTASGSAITPFSTTAFVTAFDTTFYPASCGFEWGLDFESDATPGFVQAVVDQIGEESKRWLDEQIAVGDGTTEPQGIFTASGTAVSPDSSHTFSSLTYADIVTLAFGIGKAARNAFGGSFTRFVMNDAQYKELWQIATGVTGDTRPVFANPTFQWKSYMLGDYPVSVQANISNGNLALCNLRGYRMYRRAGLSFVMDETGRTSRLANTKLLLARMRWGGKITLASTYIAEMTT